MRLLSSIVLVSAAVYLTGCKKEDKKIQTDLEKLEKEMKEKGFDSSDQAKEVQQMLTKLKGEEKLSADDKRSMKKRIMEISKELTDGKIKPKAGGGGAAPGPTPGTGGGAAPSTDDAEAKKKAFEAKVAQLKAEIEKNPDPSKAEGLRTKLAELVKEKPKGVSKEVEAEITKLNSGLRVSAVGAVPETMKALVDRKFKFDSELVPLEAIPENKRTDADNNAIAELKGLRTDVTKRILAKYDSFVAELKALNRPIPEDKAAELNKIAGRIPGKTAELTELIKTLQKTA